MGRRRTRPSENRVAWSTYLATEQYEFCPSLLLQIDIGGVEELHSLVVRPASLTELLHTTLSQLARFQILEFLTSFFSLLVIVQLNSTSLGHLVPYLSAAARARK